MSEQEVFFRTQNSAINRVGTGLAVLELIKGGGCSNCLDQIHEQGTVFSVGRTAVCKVCDSTYKSVECDGDYAQFAQAVLDKSITPPAGEFDPDPGVVELSKTHAPGIQVHTLSFLKSKWKDPKRAKAWAKRNGYHARKSSSGRYYHNLVQMPKSWVTQKSIRVIAFGSGIRAVVGKMKPEYVGKEPDDAALNEPAFAPGLRAS